MRVQITKERKDCDKQGEEARFCSIEKGGCESCTLPRNRKDMGLNHNQQQAYDIYKECYSQYVQSPDNQEKARMYYKAQQEWLNASRQRGIYKTSEENPITTEKNGKE